MKSLIAVWACMVACVTGATEVVLVDSSVAENPAAGLAGVAYRVTYDDATRLVTFKANGDTSASSCNIIFHSVSIEDDAGKSVTGYNGYCGHAPTPADILMTNAGNGWLSFSIHADEYTKNLGIFLNVVLRQDNARNLERFFGVSSMNTPNDWAGFDFSWDNRIKIVVPDAPSVAIETINTSPYLPGTANPNAATSMGNDVTISYTIVPAGFTADATVLIVKDKNGAPVYTDNTLATASGTHQVRWSVSTASLRALNASAGPYTVKIEMTKGTASYQDAETLAVEPSTVVIEAEKSATGAPITECMEKRKVTYTATARGFVSEARNHKIQFDYVYVRANGTVQTVTQWSLSLKNQYTLQMDDVPGGNTSHFYEFPINVIVNDTYTHTAMTDIVRLKVYELWIEYFRNHAPAKDWQVVVGANIAYSAIASSDCANWNWDMPDTRRFSQVWHASGGNMKQGTGMNIPYSDLPNAQNSFFGANYGTVRVSCKDEEGNRHSFDSTSMNPSKSAAVFFPRDLNVNGQAPTAANPPCWFVFWANNRGGPCSWKYGSTSSYAGGTITWGFDPNLSGCVTTPTDYPRNSRFTIKLGATDVLNTPNYTFTNSRYPATGSFTNYAAVVTNVPAGKLSCGIQRANVWEAIDKAEFCVKHEVRHVWQLRKSVTDWRQRDNADARQFRLPPPDNRIYLELLASAYEDGFGTYWQNARTYYPGFSVSYGVDSELDCEVAAGNPIMPVAQDWAFPGKQMH